VYGIGSVHEHGWSSRGIESRHDLLGYDGAFANTRHYGAPFHLQQHTHCLCKASIEPVYELFYRCGLRAYGLPRQRQNCLVV